MKSLVLFSLFEFNIKIANMDFQGDGQKKKNQFQEDHSKIDCKSKETDILNKGDTFFSQERILFTKICW